MTLDHQYTAFSAMRMKKNNAPIKDYFLSQKLDLFNARLFSV